MNRPLERVYAAVFIDAIMVKIRDAQVPQPADRPHFVGGASSRDRGGCGGRKDILGMWAGGGESAKFWMAVLTDLRNRGVQDVSVVVCDGRKGLPGSVNVVFPLAAVQSAASI